MLGDASKEFTIKVYQSGTFLNSLDPMNPTQNNTNQSDETYEEVGAPLNTETTFKFENVQNDTLFIYDRSKSLSANDTYKDTLKVANGTITSNPFIAIKLDKARLKTLLFDQYTSSDLASQNAFNDYFRGLIIEVTGEDGAIVPLSLSSTLRPSLDIIHTSTILNSDNTVKEQDEKIDNFVIGGITNAMYKTTAASIPTTAENFVIQGTAGTIANINILQGTQLNELKAKNWLINDASLVFYVNQEKDTTNTPEQLFLYKNGVNEIGDPNPSQIKDRITEGPDIYGGTLLLTSGGTKDRYHFRITDYISDLLSGTSSYNPPLGLKVYNPTDAPTSAIDTIVQSYSWNPRAITLHSNTSTNTAKKSTVKNNIFSKKITKTNPNCYVWNYRLHRL